MADLKEAKVVSRAVTSTTKKRKSKEDFIKEGAKEKTTKLIGKYEALWDCASCGTKSIGGLTKKCPTCGSPKEDRHNEVYYTAKDNKKKLSQEEMDIAGITSDHNSDHDCRYCGATLKPTILTCPICGGEVETKEVKPEQKPEEKKKFGILPLIIIGGVIIFLCALVSLIGAILGGNKKVTVDSVNWERTVTEESYQYAKQEGWELPEDAYLISQDKKQSGTEKVIVRYEDKEVCTTDQVEDGYEEVCVTEDVTYDDGTTDTIENCTNEPVYKDVENCSTEEVPVYEEKPVYDTWYIFKSWAWVEADSETLTGEDFNAKWPKIDVDEENREGEKNEEYTIIFEDNKGKQYTYITDNYDEYKKYKIGSSWKIVIDNETGEITVN